MIFFSSSKKISWKKITAWLGIEPGPSWWDPRDILWISHGHHFRMKTGHWYFRIRISQGCSRISKWNKYFTTVSGCPQAEHRTSFSGYPFRALKGTSWDILWTERAIWDAWVNLIILKELKMSKKVVIFHVFGWKFFERNQFMHGGLEIDILKDAWLIFEEWFCDCLEIFFCFSSFGN